VVERLESTFDKNWHSRALAGEHDAIDQLATMAMAPLYAFCLYRVGRDHGVCEDVVQETLLKAISRLDRYDPARGGCDIFPWLAGMARNEIRRVLARKGGMSSLESLWARMDCDLRDVFLALDRTQLADEQLAWEKTHEMVNATMSQLPSQYRDALQAKYVEQQSVREIASARSMTEKAVESLLTRARRAFRETIAALTRNLDFEIP
jgi:RNA polymerase sigma-70 factor (ECF subfamily)